MSILQESATKQVPVATNGSSKPPDVPEVGGAPTGKRSRLLRLGGFAIAILFVGAVAGYFVGHAVGNDAGKVKALHSQIASVKSQNASLRSQISSLQSGNSSLQSQISSLQSQISSLQSRNSYLKSRNAALLAASSAPVPSSGGSSVSTAGDIPFNQPGTVGSLSLTPISLTKTSGGQSDTWTLTIKVKNNGSSSADPFCSGSASMTDTQGRSYDGQTVLNFNGSSGGDCGTSLQPGLSQSGYTQTFTTPAGDKPASLSLWGLVNNQNSAQTWSAP